MTAVHLGGLENGALFKVEFIAPIGVSGKKAVLIVEFAQMPEARIGALRSRRRDNTPARAAHRHDLARLYATRRTVGHCLR